MRYRVAIVLSDVFLRRLTPGLFPLVRSGQDYVIIDIRRPVNEIRKLLDKLHPAGLLTESLPGKTEPLLELNYPTVIADSDEIFPSMISVDVDDRQVGQRAAEFFEKAAFRHYAFLGNQSPYSAQRQEGFCRQVEKNGGQVDVFIDPEPRADMYMEDFRGRSPRLAEWLKGLPKPCALFAAHDPQGRLVCENCREQQIPVPEEVAVLAVNNDDLLCNLSYPALSSVLIPWSKIGAEAGQALDELIRGKTAGGRQIRLPPGPVIARESSQISAVANPELRRALEYLRLNFQEPINIRTVCDALRIDRRGLELQCRAILDRTPLQELSRLRVEHAKQLLVQTRHKMDWIAHQSGFTDAERLSVVFKKVTGESPSQYRLKRRLD